MEANTPSSETTNQTSMGFPESIERYAPLALLIGAAAIFSYYISLFVTDNGILAYAHDGLDSSVVIFKVLAESGALFAPNATIIPDIMGGQPRAVFPSEWSLTTWFYVWFEPDMAYLINEIVLRLVGFVGMYLLIRRQYTHSGLTRPAGELIAIGLGLMFSLLPFWPHMGATISIQPLVLWAFLNIRDGDLSWKNWIVFVLAPVYSSLILAGVFILSMLSIIWLYDAFKRKKLNLHLFCALSLMSSCYLLVEYRLVLNLFDPVYVPHREEMVAKYVEFMPALKDSVKTLLVSHYHAQSLHATYLFPFIILAMLLHRASSKVTTQVIGGVLVLLLLVWLIPQLEWVKGIQNYMMSGDQLRFYPLLVLGIAILAYITKQTLIGHLLLAITITSLYAGFEDYIGIKPLKENIGLFTILQTDRFYFLIPTLWFITFAIAAINMSKKTPWTTALVLVVLVNQGIYANDRHMAERNRLPSSFDNFYMQSAFEQAKDFINLPQDEYRVITLGFNPLVAGYNGFYTLDGYMPNYDLAHKHRFREIIAPLLEKSESDRKYFDGWGSRCKVRSLSRRLTLNLDAFQELGGQYIFSARAVRINGGRGNRLVQKFRDDSGNILFLYKVL